MIICRRGGGGALGVSRAGTSFCYLCLTRKIDSAPLPVNSFRDGGMFSYSIQAQDGGSEKDISHPRSLLDAPLDVCALSSLWGENELWKIDQRGVVSRVLCGRSGRHELMGFSARELMIALGGNN